ncbi:hypothetical protein NGC23_07520 [Leclercia pneumoniae]|uniref:hypothetical protein n=1 Tax=Leclercia pneumoniae TaxID=2815358 RepID=UPI002DC04BEE|nr:hypothetical protein [Leclercia pneumoniae]MEB7500038.1 hypothetical protein [Leclercia pneumoniae]
MTKITERGMIFNGEMVRAILDGRKTQTRRIMNPQPADDITRGYFPNMNTFGWKSSLKHKHGSTTAHFCPYGKHGDRIWVRETWAEAGAGAPDLKIYRANYPAHVPSHYGNVPPAEDIRWKPSIHMPRWASRITLEITGVRVERLNSISEENARAEGVQPAGDLLPDYPDTYLTPTGDFATAKVAFQRLWESIYGDDSFQANPWVWVIEFKRIEGDDHATD